MAQMDLNAALVFVRVAQTGSFTGAARELGMPKTTVSRKVAELEEQLEARLLHRTTRKLSLTDAGAAFLDEAEAGFARFEAAEAAVSEMARAPRGKVRVTTTVPLGQGFLAPILADFLNAYPSLEVVVHLTDRQVDLVADRFDVAIRAGTLPDSALVSRLLGTSTYRVVASPAYLEAHGTPSRPAELSGHACLRFGKQGMAVRTSWPFGRGRRAFEVAVNGRLVSDDFVVLRTAAEQGLGIACLPAAIPHEALAEGRLVSLFDSLAPPPTPLHLLYVGGKHLPPRVRAFIDFVQPRMTAALRELQAG